MALSLDDAKDAKEQADNSGLRDNDAGIPDDVKPDYQEVDIPVVRGHPECLIAFDRIVGFSPFNTQDDFLSVRQNLEGAGPRGYGNQVVLTLANPELIEGVLWSEEHDFRDYRVLGDVTSDFSPYDRNEDVQFDDDGNPTDVEVNGVDLGMGGFDGEEVEDGFSEDYIQIFVSASRAARVLGALDTAGMWAIDSDGAMTEGIIEAPPELGTNGYDSETHGAPRAIGYPELRADMVDQRGAIAYTFADEEPTQQSRVEVTLYTITDDTLTALAPLTPGDDQYALPTYPRAGNLYWDHDSVGGQDMGEDAEPQSDDAVQDAQDMLSEESDDTVTDQGNSLASQTSYNGLSESGQDFIDSAVKGVNAKDYDEVQDFDDWDERWATATSGDNPDITVEQSTAEELINRAVSSETAGESSGSQADAERV